MNNSVLYIGHSLRKQMKPSAMELSAVLYLGHQNNLLYSTWMGTNIVSAKDL